MDIANPNQPVLFLFGDSAYQSKWGVIDPLRHDAGWQYLTDEMRRSNYWLSKARVGVEMAFGNNFDWFTYVHFGKAVRATVQPVGTYFLVSLLLQNCLTCLRAEEGKIGTINGMFGCMPPTLEDYLNGVARDD